MQEAWYAHTYEQNPATLSPAGPRWSPSANNVQPWRFIVGTKGTATFDTIAEQLVAFNRGWAAQAGALIVAVAETLDDEGNERPWAIYDLGQAMAHLSIQAHSDGFFAHQMAGFSADGIREAFSLPDGLVPFTVTASASSATPSNCPRACSATARPLRVSVVPSPTS